MEANLIKIKPYDESIGLSKLVDLYNKMFKYLNPETTIELTEELALIILGKETILSRDFLVFENEQDIIIAFAGASKVRMYKDAWFTIYGVLPEYIESELPGKLIEAVLNHGKKRNAPELLFQTTGELSAPFEKKLESLGYKPIHYSWSMCLDDFNLFSNPVIPHDIKIHIQKDIKDYLSCVDVLNKAFQDSFKFELLTERKWKNVQSEFKKNHIIEYCIAYEKNKIVGLCSIYLNPKQKNIGLIADFGVLPSYQHRKIGSVVLASAIEKLIEKGCSTINLTVHAENEKALGLYKKFGFYLKNNLTEKIYQII